jgi:two-component system sensor histidine kinase/response regulator
VTQSLRALLLGLTSLAVVMVTCVDLAINVKMRTDRAETQLTETTQRLLAASTPLLVSALVVGDLASAEQTIRNLNAGRVWRQARLYEPDGLTLIFDASPPEQPEHRAPLWFGRLLGLELAEARAEIAAPPTVYGVLAVVPSSDEVEQALWHETRTMVTFAVMLLVTLIVLLHFLLAYGLRSVRALGASAARFGAGDLTMRMPDSRLAEIAPTVRAFNTMAENLQRLMATLEAKEAANRELAAGVEQAQDAILTVDLDRRVRTWNRGASQLFGRPAEAMLGCPIATLFSSDEAKADLQARRLFEMRSADRLEFILTRGLTGERVVAASASVLHDEAGRHSGYIVIARDVTMRRDAEQALRQAKEAAEVANRAKAEFLATMSHEIRTPMNGILGMNELLLASELTAEQRERAMLVQSSAQALLHIIDDILDFSKIEAGRIELETIAFDLRATIGQALKPLALRAHEKGLELVYAVDPAVPVHVVGDPGRLRQVVVNLVGNAVKFTERGEVVVRIEGAAVEGNEVVLRFVIRDTGIGVPAEKRELIFDAFTQADSSTTRRFGGTGLGLAITRRLVELMNGRVWLDTPGDGGSAFAFTARFPVAAGPAPAGPGVSQLDGLRVLVVDDNATSRSVVTELLQAWGLTPLTVDGATAALAALEQAKVTGAVPGLILTDQEMPGIDGLTLVQRLKAEPGLAGIPVVMLSSSSRPEDAARARQLGVGVVLSKPMTSSELLDAIMSVLGPPRTTLAPTTAVAVPAGAVQRGLRVLVAEDNAVNQRVAVGLLERQGHHVVAVGNGRAALQALESKPFDVVFMDIEMPELDGFEATAVVREREKEIRNGIRPVPAGSAYAVARAGDRRIPIIALTAHAMKGMEERCLAARMDGYLSKPLRSDMIDTMLARLAPELAGPASTEVPAAAETLAAVDHPAALRSVGGDASLLADVMRVFLEDCPARLADLRGAVASRDAEHLQRAAHAIKGAVGTFAAWRARDLAADLERAGRERRLDAVPGLMQALEAELERVQDVLRRECGPGRGDGDRQSGAPDREATRSGVL